MNYSLKSASNVDFKKIILICYAYERVAVMIPAFPNHTMN